MQHQTFLSQIAVTTAFETAVDQEVVNLFQGEIVVCSHVQMNFDSKTVSISMFAQSFHALRLFWMFSSISKNFEV